MIRLNKNILITLTGFFFTVITNGQWISEEAPTTNNLNSIYLLSDNSGWIVGDNGTIIYRTNDSWKNYKKITDEDLYSVFMLNDSSGWTVGARGTILHYSGGQWEEQLSPTNQHLYSVSFRDNNYGIAVGAGGTVIFYDGTKWKLTDNVSKGNLYALITESHYSMFGGGMENVSIPVIKILDINGKKSPRSFDPEFTIIKSMAIQDHNNIWAVGVPGTIIHYNGQNWEKINQPEKLPSLNNVFFYDKKTGITVGFAGTILTYSTDGWKKEDSPVNVRLNGTTITEKSFYAVGNKGTIISQKRLPEIISPKTSLDQPAVQIESYPNPASNLLNILIPEEKDMIGEVITVSNAYGQILIKDEIEPGTMGLVYELNTSHFSSGLYLIKITSRDGKNASGKFMVRH